MATIKWEPFRGVAALQNRINRAFEDAFPASREVDDEMAMCAWRPAVDIYKEDGVGVVVRADLPGVAKTDVSVEVKDNMLMIRGERKGDESISDEKYLRRERPLGTFSRSFNLKEAIHPDKISARFKDGVLKIIIPEPEESKPQKIKVNVE